MKVEVLGRIAMNVLVALLILTGASYLYSLRNPFDFPGLWQRLLFFDMALLLVVLFVHSKSILHFLGQNVKLKFKVRMPKKKFKYKYDYAKQRKR